MRRLGNAKFLTEMWEKQGERYGVLSLSKSRCNEHLWNHYAEGGTGLCIEFNFEAIVDSQNTSWCPFEVEYEDTPPDLNILDFYPPSPELISEFVRRSFRVKTRQWQAEEEVRVVYEVGDKQPPKVPVPPKTIRALYLGPLFSDQDREAVLSWRSSVAVYRARADASGVVAGFDRIR